MVQELLEASRGADSFRGALQKALESIRVRTSAQWVMLLEPDGGGRFGSTVCSDAARHDFGLPAKGVLASRLGSLSLPLPLHDADYAAWLRWAEENRPAHVEELRALREAGVRLAMGLRTRKELVGVLINSTNAM